MPEHHRLDDREMPSYMRWLSAFIVKIGFPIAMCIWFCFKDWSMGKEIMKSLNEFREVMTSLKVSIDQQNRILRRRGD